MCLKSYYISLLRFLVISTFFSQKKDIPFWVHIKEAATVICPQIYVKSKTLNVKTITSHWTILALTIPEEYIRLQYDKNRVIEQYVKLDSISVARTAHLSSSHIFAIFSSIRKLHSIFLHICHSQYCNIVMYIAIAQKF